MLAFLSGSANFSLLVSVSVSGLGKSSLADTTFERVLVSVDPQMVFEVAQFWKGRMAVLALQGLVHPLGDVIHLTD